MVRADQGIQGRSAPRAKSRSSATAAIRARSSTSAPKVAAAPPTKITKAAKRAMKRAELMAKVDPKARPSLLNLEPTNGTLSKSSLRRQKRKQKEQLAGNTTGLKDLAEAMDEVAQEVQGSDEDDEDAYDIEDGGDDDDDMLEKASRQPATSAYPLVGAQKTKKDATVTEKARKKALSLEMQRQNLILSDPAYARNPFAALRLHAQNTLAFDKGNPKPKH
ncbi:hypothetical protein PSEUBRA_000365 [Kalmanozyma brasiliensis GHG001]|uniref:Ribosome biogenesis protein SLX9 n=1 Tax=Kalmanozyma brasiliensis (strain GHG001) TaxID=1365824 RepID=V5EWK6_KALBG|nr:uncharacterized protein PSEUBRA_000365 [Kalmanozyma brasiliensis GHG001]EST09965.1 hypothetical protein PSEUBRA_000365 [Kalmanozyma brasiliensis GHG001]